jgi:hypothetical protein
MAFGLALTMCSVKRLLQRPMRASRFVHTFGLFMSGIAVGCALAVATEPHWPSTFRQIYQPARLPFDEKLLQDALTATDRTAQAATRTIGATSQGAAGAALAKAIRFSRMRARAAATFPIPPLLRERLAPYFPAAMLEKVRYSLAGRRVSLGSALASWHLKEGAVTLDDTVVFTNARAAADLRLWAHELTHVQQYDELGVDGFGRLYAFDWQLVEREAQANAEAIVTDLKASDSARAKRIARRTLAG